MRQGGKKRALGRGLNALLSDQPTSEVLSQAKQVPISQIRPNRFQPRTRFDKGELDELIASVKRDGVLMPILVRPGESGFELIAGERRWRAAQAAGLLEIPAVVREVDDRHALELAIVENEQRDDLTAIESARAYQRLIEEFHYTQQQVAECIGVSRMQVSNLIRLLQLPESIQGMIERRELDMGHARPLVGLPEGVARHLAAESNAKSWSVRQMEREAKRALQDGGAKRSRKKPVDADVEALQEQLGRTLGLPVEFRCKADGSGELRIRYGRPEELDGVLARLRGRT
ncbi:MAG TPA: ParB/RepB/Spo0J family partition protein [Mariprofundaceae bacterium]|nr:ParB/RepB/Spo0J family partition protein [Mariprofundaceae bacterium]